MATRRITLGSAADPGAAERPHACRARHVSLCYPSSPASVQPLEPYEASGLYKLRPSELGSGSNEIPRVIEAAGRLQ
jgi:hypothetical protein